MEGKYHLLYVEENNYLFSNVKYLDNLNFLKPCMNYFQIDEKNIFELNN